MILFTWNRDRLKNKKKAQTSAIKLSARLSRVHLFNLKLWIYTNETILLLKVRFDPQSQTMSERSDPLTSAIIRLHVAVIQPR